MKNIVKVVTEASFMDLSASDQVSYEHLREIVAAIQAQDNGLELILNALVATGPEATFEEIGTWVEGVRGLNFDSRRLTALCHGPERLLTVESRLVDDNNDS
ncbi:MAG: hypothetical protein ACHQTE_01740 [Candidatus Saccharimonadales bacterium]